MTDAEAEAALLVLAYSFEWRETRSRFGADVSDWICDVPEGAHPTIIDLYCEAQRRKGRKIYEVSCHQYLADGRDEAIFPPLGLLRIEDAKAAGERYFRTGRWTEDPAA